MKTNSDKTKGFDRPIQKPFDELPESFMRNLRSRWVTKKMKRQEPAGKTNGFDSVSSRGSSPRDTIY